jgi:hypothetical protein
MLFSRGPAGTREAMREVSTTTVKIPREGHLPAKVLRLRRIRARSLKRTSQRCSVDRPDRY